MTTTERLRELLWDEVELPFGVNGYTVGSSGVIYSYTEWRGSDRRALAAHPDDCGYLRVHINVRGRRICRQVHRIVCESFHGPPMNRQHQVRHLDGNKLNNSANNLAWGTAKENAADRDTHGTTARGERNGMSSLDADDVIAVRVLYSRGMRPSVLAAWLGTTKETIIKCANGETYV